MVFCCILQYFVAKSVFFCNLRCFVAKPVLVRITRFCVEKNLAKNCARGEKMTNMRYEWRWQIQIHVFEYFSLLWQSPSRKYVHLKSAKRVQWDRLKISTLQGYCPYKVTVNNKKPFKLKTLFSKYFLCGWDPHYNTNPEIIRTIFLFMRN